MTKVKYLLGHPVKRIEDTNWRLDLKMWETKVTIITWLISFVFYEYRFHKNGSNIFFKKLYKYKSKQCKYYKFFPLPPVIYTLQEAKDKWKSRWSIPVSPEIMIKHKNKLYKINELKEIWQ